MKTLIGICVLFALFCVPASASSYLTLEATQFVRATQERQPVVGAKLDLDLTNTLRLVVSGRKSLDFGDWKENKIGGLLKLDVGSNVYFAFEAERYYSRDEERYWFTIGTRIKL